MKDKVDLTKILRVNLVGVVVFVALAILAVFVMNQTGYQVIANYWTSNGLASQPGTVFAPTSHVLFSFQMRWSVVALMIISSVVPAFYIYLIRTKQKSIDLEKYRFIDWSLTTSFMVVLVAVLSGVQDLTTLILIGSLTIIGYIFTWFAVHDRIVTKKSCVLAVISESLPWFLIAVYALSTLGYGMVRSPWYVYVLYLLGIAKLAVIIAGFFDQNMNNNKVSLTNKLVYSTAINQFFNVAFVLVLIIGLSR